MVVNAIFNNISVISWRSVLFVEESGLPGENHRPAASHWKLYHIMLYRVHLTCAGFELTTVMVIGIDYIGICKSNYYTITTTTAIILYIGVYFRRLLLSKWITKKTWKMLAMQRMMTLLYEPKIESLYNWWLSMMWILVFTEIESH
jgi:hypothetical protein